MNFTEITSLATMLSGIGACVSAIATFLTVREMKKQREASYKPDVFVAPCSFTGGEASALQQGKKAVFSFLNLGMGAAKDVKIVMQTDIQMLLPELNALLVARKIPTVLHLDKDFSITHYAGDSESTNSVSIVDRAFIQYMITDMKENIEIAVPEYISLFIDFIFKSVFEDDIQECKNLLKRLNIVLQVTCNDIGGKSHKSTLRICFVDCQYSTEKFSYIARFK